MSPARYGRDGRHGAFSSAAPVKIRPAPLALLLSPNLLSPPLSVSLLQICNGLQGWR